MESGEVSRYYPEFNMTKYSVKGLKCLLGAFFSLCGQAGRSGLDMLDLTMSLADDPLSRYIEESARGAEKLGSRLERDDEGGDEITRQMWEVRAEMEVAEGRAQGAVVDSW
jgi:hypothetical protein